MKNIVTLTILLGALTACQSKNDNKTDHAMHAEKEALQVEVVNTIDPVCEMDITKAVKDTATYESQLYGFCSTSCKSEFQKSPEKFVKK
ncbi:YHS domain-containing protein [Elizabethkingia sp. JS20170427COW]|uniref:YHS domain-containing protein n=1 Tax=Elizabethkingia sp. JS20170427COW TaxID=2583851 RepID=UPI00143CDEE0|nr:YHS domain-containing protein [Elizabethkingia sp. JS20170427COW]